MLEGFRNEPRLNAAVTYPLASGVSLQRRRGHMRKQIRLLILAAVVVAVTASVFLGPPIPQDPTYHNFADHRAVLGVPNFLDVISNVPFLCVGIWGLLVVIKCKPGSAFLNSSERWPYVVFFLGVALTFFGSSYYHFDPRNAHLVWDRLPMTLGFMGILSAMVAERISVRAGVRLLPLLVLAGVLSVAYWYWTETQGRGDLRPYFDVQFGSLLILLAVLILFPPRYTHTWCVVVAISFYVGAKLLESFDPEIYAIGHVVSGHTLKHLAAASGGCLIVLMLQRRTAARDSSDRWRPAEVITAQ